MALHVSLYDLGAAGGAVYLAHLRAAVALMGLQVDILLEMQSTPKALEWTAAAALAAPLAPPWRRRLWTRWEW